MAKDFKKRAFAEEPEPEVKEQPKVEVPKAVVTPLTEIVDAWAREHIIGTNHANGEHGEYLMDKIQTLKATLGLGVKNVSAAVMSWKVEHLHNSPVSGNTEFMNALQPKLAALITLLGNVGKTSGE